MEPIEVEIDNRIYQGACALSGTLEQFLRDVGLDEVPEMLRDARGRQVVPAYTFAHLVKGCSFIAEEKAETQPVPALTPDQALTTVSGPF
jgi:hypothetical protein